MQLTMRSIFFSLACVSLAIFGLAVQQPAAAAIVILGPVAYLTVLRMQTSHPAPSTTLPVVASE